MDIHRLYRRLNRGFRRRRMFEFSRRLRIGETTTVVDVGGTPYNWAFTRAPRRVVIVNTRHEPSGGDPRFSLVVADGRRLPFRDGAFDVVFSNAVIEHVGGRENQERFASECRRVGRRYFVQTPNRRFPVEPHLLTPFVHWLPRRWEGRLLRNGTVWGWLQRPSQRACREFMENVYLLDQRQMRAFFPDGQLVRERFLGMTKSIVAVKAEEA